MCGRYQAWLDDDMDELINIVEREKKGSRQKYFRQNEVYPGTEMPIIYGSYSTVRAHRAVWGFPVDRKSDDLQPLRQRDNAFPEQTSMFGTELGMDEKRAVKNVRYRSDIVINARAETADNKPMFRYAFENGRALVLASGYYEWSDGVKYRFTDNSAGERRAFLMAALEKTVDDERRYVILTTEALGTPAEIHDRMPVFIGREEMRDWLYDDDCARKMLQRHLPCRMSVERV
ncbi:MAG: SOS response-associated peptidase family protein [Eubacteriales bacterium]